MAKYIVNLGDEISVHEKIFLAAIVQAISDDEIRQYIQNLICHSYVVCRTATHGYGMYIDFKTVIPKTFRQPVPQKLLNATSLIETAFENCQIDEIPNNQVYLMLYLTDDKTELDFLEITSLEFDFHETKLAHLIMDTMFFRQPETVK